MGGSSKLLRYTVLGAVLTVNLICFNNCGGSFVAGPASNQQTLASSSNEDSTPGTGSDPLPESQLPLPSTNPPGPAPVYESLRVAAESLQPGQWYELPAKNKISDVFPVRKSRDNWFGWSSAVVNAWGGGTVAQGKLFIWGGGHNDYGGNEVYTFDLESWTWTRVTDPSNYKNYPCGYTEPTGPCQTVDGTPVSVHSYNGINYIPTTGQFWVGGGALYSTAGGFGAQSALFDLGSKIWRKLPDLPRGGAMVSAWDELSQKLLVISNEGNFFTYNPATNKNENISAPNWSVNVIGDFDPVHRKFVLFTPNKPGFVYVYDFSNIDLKANTAVEWNRFNFQATQMNGQPFSPNLQSASGMVYCPDRKLFVLWDGRSPDVWTLDPATWIWNRIPSKGVAPPVGETQGVYGRWKYLPEYKVFLAYDNINRNPWIYKLP